MLVRTDILTSAEFEDAYARAAAFWKYPEDSTAVLSGKRLRERFSEPPTDAIYHHVPTAFPAEDDFAFMPVSWDMRWPSLEKNIERFGPRSVVALLPFTFQVEPVIIAALRRTRTLGTTVLPGNTPLAREMIRRLGSELVVATPATATELLSNINLPAALPVKVWHLIVSPSDVPTKTALPGLTLNDLHIVPGHSIAWQCPNLSDKDLHPSPLYAWHVENEKILLTSLDKVPAPLFRYPAGKGTLREQVCACGAQHTLSLL